MKRDLRTTAASSDKSWSEDFRKASPRRQRDSNSDVNAYLKRDLEHGVESGLVSVMQVQERHKTTTVQSSPLQ